MTKPCRKCYRQLMYRKKDMNVSKTVFNIVGTTDVN